MADENKVVKVARRGEVGTGKRRYNKADIRVPKPDKKDGKAISKVIEQHDTGKKQAPAKIVLKQHTDGTIERVD